MISCPHLTREPTPSQLQQSQNKEDTEDDYSISRAASYSSSLDHSVEREGGAAKMELLFAELYNGDVAIPGFKELCFSEQGIQEQELLYWEGP
jgi:hypothetical protein